MDDILEISALIGLHMDVFGWETEETKEKKRKLLGQKLYDKLRVLHESDEDSSYKSFLLSDTK